MVLTHTIETDGRQADANQHMVLTHTIETDGRRPHNRNTWPHNSRATGFCHAWPILWFGVVHPFIPLLPQVVNATYSCASSNVHMEGEEVMPRWTQVDEVTGSGGNLAPSLGGRKKFSRTKMTFFPEKNSHFPGKNF